MTPNPVDAGANATAALRSLDRLNADRTLVVLDETTPSAAAINRLIAAGRVRSAVGSDGASGIYWIRVDLPS